MPRQVGIRVKRAKVEFRSFADEQPGAAVAAVIGVAAAVGMVVWLIVRANLRD